MLIVFESDVTYKAKKDIGFNYRSGLNYYGIQSLEYFGSVRKK